MNCNLRMYLPILAVLLFAGPSLAEGQEGISVTGHGSYAVVPDQLEVVGTIREASTDAEDTIVAFRDSARRATEAIEKLSLDGLTVSHGQPAISLVTPSQGGMGAVIMMGPGGPAAGEAPAVDPEYVMTEEVTIRLPGFDALDRGEQIEMMGLVMAACQEAGIDVTDGGGGGNDFGMMFAVTTSMAPDAATAGDIARLTYSDADTAIAAAREQAIADAREQAEQLAELTGVTLGRVTAVSAGMTTTSTSDDGKLVYHTPVDVTYAIE